MPRAKSRTRTSTRTRAKPAGRHPATEPPHTLPRDVAERRQISATAPPRSPFAADLPRFLTIDEVADLLRTSRRAIYAQIRRGAFPGVIRLSRRLLVERGALVEWLNSKRAVSLTNEGDQR
ncbi:MAG: helix-turn-helix domain-containing protein [Nannocystaceae bacterium]